MNVIGLFKVLIVLSIVIFVIGFIFFEKGKSSCEVNIEVKGLSIMEIAGFIVISCAFMLFFVGCLR